jgi:KDO2-lipid IV(A) lauroyltransferase
MVDRVLLIVAKATYRGLSLLPHRFRITLFTLLFRLLFGLLPKVKRSIHTNLALAFPDKDEEWRRVMVKKNAVEVARLAADAVRLPSLDASWVQEHVSCPILPQYLATLQKQQGKGLLIATGHLGSFELLGHAIGLMGHPLAAVARNFRSDVFDKWWTGLREARGNKIIGRKGAFKEIVATISSGMSTAVLFDQNVTRNHAVFVDWFGTPAATSKSLALAVLRCEVPVYVASIRYVGDDKYRIEAEECDFSSVCKDETLTSEQKVKVITEKLSTIYVEMIRKFPEGWFWMHRRWKTRPEGEPENIYK